MGEKDCWGGVDNNVVGVGSINYSFRQLTKWIVCSLKFESQIALLVNDDDMAPKLVHKHIPCGP